VQQVASHIAMTLPKTQIKYDLGGRTRRARDDSDAGDAHEVTSRDNAVMKRIFFSQTN